ncbi:beta-N-acetylhexosaminidase [Streptomyces capparidis]
MRPGSLLRSLTALLLCLGATAASSAAAAPAPAADPAPDAPGYDRLVPAPAEARATGGAGFALGPATRIHVPADSREAARVGEYLAGILRPSTGYRLPVTTAPGRGGIVFVLGRGGTGPEGYRLDVTDRAVTVTAERPAGLFHAVQTLRQLLPPRVESRERRPGPWTVPAGTVTDRPRYAHRGAMLDLARHFFTVDQVKRYIDQLALYKVNRLHLHLTDDQGWRIAVESWPRLATYGGSTQVGGGPGGYWTKEQYREVVRYAASRYLTVIPEIDMPGHTNAALASYPELNCDGVAPPLYTGIEVGFSSLCVDKEVTYDFVDDVVREIAALTPGEYLHIGGDEAHATSHEDYVAFMDRAQRTVARYGKTVVGWHQLTGARPAEGAVAQYWGVTGTEPEVAAAARAGTRLILSPANRTYLDMKYDPATPLGLNWAGYVEVRQSYDWDPATYVQGAPASAVLGVEAPLWTETITTSDHIEYMAFPRLPAVAELGWSPAHTHDWESFRQRLAAQGPRWDVLGIDYHRSPQVPWPAG